MAVKKSTKQILWHMRNEKCWAGVFLLLGLCIMVLSLYEPLLAKQIMDAAFEEGKRNVLYTLIGIWGGVFLMKYGCLYVRETLGLRFMLKMMECIQMEYFKKLLRAQFSYFKQYPDGYIQSRHVNDFYNLEGMMLNHLVDGFLGLVQAFVILAFLIQIHMVLGIMAAFLKAVDIIGNYWFPLTRLYKEHNEAASQLEKELQEDIRGIGLIKCGTAEDREARRYRKEALQPFYETWKKRDAANILRRLVTGASMDASFMAIIGAGGWFVSEGSLTVGEIMAFLLFYQKLGGAVNLVIPVIPLFKIGQASAERLYELQAQMGMESGEKSTGDRLTVRQGISFQHVCFTEGTRKILQDVTMTIQPGKVTALVGRSGSGKTMIVNLLLRFLEAGGGQITIDGQPIQKIPLDTLRRSIACLPQEPILFQRTFRENVGYHLDEKDREDSRLVAAMEEAAAGQILLHHAGRLDKNVPMVEKNVSGGEKQRLCIARELLKDSPIYIFDESTSALDSLSDQVIQKTVHRLAKEKKKAVLVIAHRMAGIQDADQIYVLDEGRITESGTHNALMKGKGLYYQLYTKQAREHNPVNQFED